MFPKIFSNNTIQEQPSATAVHGEKCGFCATPMNPGGKLCPACHAERVVEGKGCFSNFGVTLLLISAVWSIINIIYLIYTIYNIFNADTNVKVKGKGKTTNASTYTIYDFMWFIIPFPLIFISIKMIRTTKWVVVYKRKTLNVN